MTQQLGTLAAFGEDYNLISGSPIMQLKTACNCSYSGSDTF